MREIDMKVQMLLLSVAGRFTGNNTSSAVCKKIRANGSIMGHSKFFHTHQNMELMKGL